MKTRPGLDWSRIKYFVPGEFDDPNWLGSHIYMDQKTILLLDKLRADMNCPIITHNKYGVHGCVCMTKGHHSQNSFHNYDNPNGCSAVDFHFQTNASRREQAREVLKAGFGSIGIYQDVWKWVDRKGKLYILPLGFHVDCRAHYQVWKFEKGEYIYLLR